MGVGTVAVFSVLLAAIPLSAFFATINGKLDATLAPFLGQTQITDSNRLILAGIIGVVCVNLIVAAFLVAAWREPSSTSQQPPTPPLTRLQREAQKLVAIDVEYAHICTSTGQRYQLPAEICLVDYEGKILFKSFCNGFDAYNLNPETLEFEFKGGIPRREWLPAPKLKEIKPKLIQIISEKEVAVVGHNLGKDLTSLGLDKIVPLTRRRDTMRYPALQGPSGFGRTLAELARKKLNRKIQVESRHDPAEDAIAAMDLYLEYCHYDPNLMEYDDLVEYYASQIIKPCSVTD